MLTKPPRVLRGLGRGSSVESGVAENAFEHAPSGGLVEGAHVAAGFIEPLDTVQRYYLSDAADVFSSGSAAAAARDTGSSSIN
jgi:hypothetical protein